MNYDKFDVLSKNAVEKSIKSAQLFGHKVLDNEHLLLGLLKEENGVASKVLKKIGINEKLLEDKILRINKKQRLFFSNVIISPRCEEIFELSKVFAKRLKSDLIQTEHILLAIIQEGNGNAIYILNELKIDEKLLVKMIVEKDYESSNVLVEEKNEKSSSKILEKYGKNLTKLAKENKIDPVIGRENEIERVMQILTRRNKSNPVLIGDPGVGKTAIVEGLAKKLVEESTVDYLKNKVIYTLEIGMLLAGAKYRGEFESRIKKIVDEVLKNDNIILFIDEIHTIVGAGATGESSVDASNILKPLLARGDLKVIGATTIEEYRKYIEKDLALERRFQKVMVCEPSKEDTIKIIKGLKSKYEAHHNVKILDEAIVEAVNLSYKYINDRFLPDKAIDLIDEASSKVRLNLNKNNNIYTNKIIFEKDDYGYCNNFNKAVVKKFDIAKVVEDLTKIPINNILKEEADKLLNLESILEKRVIGQKKAVKEVSKAIRRFKTGLKDPKKPISFLFLGPTGVGKTELSKAISEIEFGDENKIIRFDMSEYMEKHTVSKLIGSPPGYVGYDENGQLTEKIRRNPYSIILFDEIEKAHIDVFNVFLQILDDGRLTDSKGRVVDFKNTIIIMTSNIGANKLQKEKVMGFGLNNENNKLKNEEIMINELKKTFKPEFINRIDDIIVFNELQKEDLSKIVQIMTKDLIKRLKEIEIEIELSEKTINFICEEGYNKEYGARPLKRAIQKQLEDRLSEAILKGDISKGSQVYVDIECGKVVFNCLAY